MGPYSARDPDPKKKARYKFGNGQKKRCMSQVAIPAMLTGHKGTMKVNIQMPLDGLRCTGCKLSQNANFDSKHP